jgi:hypothetical protein
MGRTSKHQQDGKHRLEYDVIFKGKKEDVTEEDNFISTYQDNFQYDPGTDVYEEAYNNDDFRRRKKVKEKVYEVIKEKTDINLETSRRKPSRVDFNKYFVLLKKETRDENFTNVEIFNELAVYFSDNLFSIFKLLDNEWRNLIIAELQDHIGKVPDESKDITVKNLKEGSEIEFIYFDDLDDEEKIITGVILEYDSNEEIFKVDSFENIYLVKINNIVKILNNRKFKYNLNKLNNIDFL